MLRKPRVGGPSIVEGPRHMNVRLSQSPTGIMECSNSFIENPASRDSVFTVRGDGALSSLDTIHRTSHASRCSHIIHISEYISKSGINLEFFFPGHFHRTKQICFQEARLARRAFQYRPARKLRVQFGRVLLMHTESCR